MKLTTGQEAFVKRVVVAAVASALGAALLGVKASSSGWLGLFYVVGHYVLDFVGSIQA